MENVWYVRRIMTWVRHCICVPSLPPYEGLMRIGHGKFDDEELVMVMANLVEGIGEEFGISGEDETVATDL